MADEQSMLYIKASVCNTSSGQIHAKKAWAGVGRSTIWVLKGITMAQSRYQYSVAKHPILGSCFGNPSMVTKSMDAGVRLSLGSTY